MIYVVSVLLVLSLVINGIQFVGMINLSRKYEAIEDSNQEFTKFFELLNGQAQEIYRQIKSIDIRGSFEADDDVGIIYKGIRQITLSLTNFFEAQDGTQEKE